MIVMKDRWSIKNSPHAVRTLDEVKTKGPAQAELGRGTLVSFTREFQRVGSATRRGIAKPLPTSRPHINYRRMSS